ncbi:enhancer of mRNA-decapping protein 4-like [Nymphalis io]|uniref:enhancer of mRNA-decapping protein 4-like n=1 Tax=Inachis io TaxID=171585 RepID=UPI002168ED9C|nr:enhancer of mRNA-decapping protein 4-like [Nymphalis io]
MSSHFHSNLTKSRSVDTLNTPNDRYVKREKSYDRFCDYFNRDNHLQSDSSQDICVIIDDRSDVSSFDKEQLDTGVANTSKLDDENLSALDKKICKLNNMLLEQHFLLKALKEDLLSSNCVISSLPSAQRPDFSRDSTNTLDDVTKVLEDATKFDDRKIRTKDLIDMTKTSQIQNVDREIRQLLIDFLQSDDLKDRIAYATAESVKEVIGNCFSATFPSAYLPIMQQSHRRLLRHVTRTLENAFNELEAGSSFFKSVHKTSRSLQVALEKHQVQLENNKLGNIFDNLKSTLQIILKNELKEWREKLLGILMPQLQPDVWEENSSLHEKEIFSHISPPQPADPERSIIDQLMKSAEINKQIKEGDINKSFEEALSSSDLSLVMAACKAADLDKVFSTPCSLKQSVLLSLVQQLATDMVHDTQLKCRYLEEAIINLNLSDHTTRVHLPLVVGEVNKHLTKFLRSFPSHVANRRISLIIMAANNLLK